MEFNTIIYDSEDFEEIKEPIQRIEIQYTTHVYIQAKVIRYNDKNEIIRTTGNFFRERNQEEMREIERILQYKCMKIIDDSVIHAQGDKLLLKIDESLKKIAINEINEEE